MTSLIPQKEKVMTEPTTSATVAVAVGAPVLSIAAAQIEFTLWPFGLAFFFAALTLMAYETNAMPIKKAFFNVIASTSLGGGLSQISAPPVLMIATAWAPSIKPWADTAQIPMTMLIATVIGLTAHKLIPKLLELIGGYRSKQS
jgi:hypothetical protein